MKEVIVKSKKCNFFKTDKILKEGDLVEDDYSTADLITDRKGNIYINDHGILKCITFPSDDEKEVEFINEIIAESIKHGADLGGIYNSNLEGLIESVNKWLMHKNLIDKYELVDDIYLGEGWYLPQIIKKINM